MAILLGNDEATGSGSADGTKGTEAAAITVPETKTAGAPEVKQNLYALSKPGLGIGSVASDAKPAAQMEPEKPAVEEAAVALVGVDVTAAEAVLIEKELRRARKKFDQMDADGNGTLDGEEMERLANWVFDSFHPGG